MLRAPTIHKNHQSCEHISLQARLIPAPCLTPQPRSNFQMPSLKAAQSNLDLQTDLRVRCEVSFLVLDHPLLLHLCHITPRALLPFHGSDARGQVLQSNITAAGYVGLQDLTPIHSHPSQSSKKKLRFDSV